MEKKLSRYIDFSTLRPEMTINDVKAALKQAIKLDCVSVCVRPCDIEYAVDICKGSDTMVGCVLDFPHGSNDKAVKAFMAEDYIKRGVAEIDMVMNYSFAKSDRWDIVKEEIQAVADICHKHSILLKVIFETGYLNDDQIIKATQICIECGVDYTKTCTGFANPVTLHTVKVMNKAANGKIKVKISGPGIYDYETAEQFVDLGSERLGLGYKFAEGILAAENNK